MPYLLALVFILSGCGLSSGARPGAGPPPADSAAGDDLDALRQEIDREVGDATAGSAAACRVMPLGHKPCGGPASYLVYSTEASDEARLTDLATRYTELQRAQNEALGLSSDCAVTPAPVPAWEGGRCVAGAP